MGKMWVQSVNSLTQSMDRPLEFSFDDHSLPNPYRMRNDPIGFRLWPRSLKKSSSKRERGNKPTESDHYGRNGFVI